MCYVNLSPLTQPHPGVMPRWGNEFRRILLRMNRSIQSEGAFGVVKQNYGFRQFLLRGQKKVTTEIFLLAMAYDVNKLHAKIQQNRTGRQLFEKDTA